MLSPYECILVFGGGLPSGFSVLVEIASTGALSLNNSGDSVFLYDADDVLVDLVVYGAEAGKDQSLTRFPDGEGNFMLHSVVPKTNGAAFSAGSQVNGQPFAAPSPQAVPEPSGLVLFGIGGMGGALIRRKRRLR